MAAATNLIEFHIQSNNYSNNNYSNNNTRNLKNKLNQIGKTDKTMFNRFRNVTSKSKSDTFLDKINTIITEIDPRSVVEYNPDHHKKILEIKNLLTVFKQKKASFRVQEIENKINEILRIFIIKEAIDKVKLNEEIKSALKGTIDIRGNNKQNTNKKFKETIMGLYKQFLDKYIENYESSNKEQIKLLDIIHHLFYKNYNHLIDKQDQEILKKMNYIDILKQYQFYKNYLQPNKFLTNQNKPKISQELVKLATKIYEYANSLDLIPVENITKFNQLKDMLHYLILKYSAIFIESQINRTARQTISNYTGPNKTIYNNLSKKHKNLNNKIKKLEINMSKFPY